MDSLEWEMVNSDVVEGGATHHKEYITTPKISTVFCVAIAIKEKNAPRQSMVKKPKSIPTTRPLRLRISKGTGM